MLLIGHIPVKRLGMKKLQDPVFTAALNEVPDESLDSKAGGKSKPRVRERIIEAATQLFYRHGINNVGIDAIVNEAGTNKMSLYRNFSSKEDLVVQYLQDHEQEHLVERDALMNRYLGNPRGQIEAFFELMVEKCHDKDTCGCPSANVAIELRGQAHPALEIVHAGRKSLRNNFCELLAAAGAKKPDLLSDTLMLLLEGGLMSKVTFKDEDWPAKNLLDIVKRLLDAELPPSTATSTSGSDKA